MNIDSMSEIAEIVDTLENRLLKIVTKLDDLGKNNEELKEELKRAVKVIANQSEAFEDLKKQYDTLKIANSLLGSDDNKRDTKLKINSLIREIDYCIAQLSD